LPDDEELIKEMPPLMIDYSALMGRVFFFFFSKWRKEKIFSTEEKERKKE